VGITLERRRLGASFWRLWCATGISASGDGLVTVAIPLLALTVTRNLVAIAGVTATNRTAAALASLPAGMAADRFDRRRLMLVCNLAAGTVLLGLVISMTSGVADLAVLYLTAGILAACDTTYALAMQASFPDIVHPDYLAVANSRLMAVDGAGAQFLGPGGGGVLFALARRLPFVADAVSFFVSAWLIRGIVPMVVGGPAGNGGAGLGVPSGRDRYRWWPAFKQGLQQYRAKRPLLLLTSTVSSVSFCQGMVFALLVVYARFTLHLSPGGYGLLLALAAALGVAGAFSSSALQRRFGAGRVIACGAAATAVSYCGMAVTRSAVLAVFMLGIQEVGVAVANVGSVTTRQQLIPRELYGRVGSVHRLVVNLAVPLGALFGGLVASVSSVPTCILVAGVCDCVALVLLGPALLRRLAAAGVR